MFNISKIHRVEWTILTADIAEYCAKVFFPSHAEMRPAITEPSAENVVKLPL